MNERSEHDMIDEIVRRTVEGEPRRDLSPFFAARTTSAAWIEADEHRQRSRSRGRSALLATYWFLLLASTILMIAPFSESGTGRAVLAILVPAGFGLALYWREVLVGFLRFVSIFLE